MTRPSLDTLFDATIVLDADSRMRGFSASAEVTFRRRAADVVGLPVTDLLPRLNDRGVEGRWRTPAVDAEGSLFPVEIALWPGEDERTVVLIRDLRLHEPQAATADDGGWWEFDPVSQDGFWSPRTYQLHGVEPASFRPNVESVLALIEPDDHGLIHSKLEAVLAGERVAPFDYHLANAPDGVRVLAVTVLEDRSSAQATLRGICTDVTAERLTRARLDAHQAVASTLGNWENCYQDMRGLLQRLFLVLGWRLAVFWTPEQDLLTCRGFVAETGMEVIAFERATRSLMPRRGGATLCGRAWAARTSQAVADLGQSDLVEAQTAREEGIRGALAIPAMHGDELLGVFEFLAPERRDLEPEMLDTFDAIGRQFGSFLSARRSLLAPPLLTVREREVVLLASRGSSVREIAAELVISSATVKTHFQNLYGKLGVNDRPAAVALALRTGLIA